MTQNVYQKNIQLKGTDVEQMHNIIWIKLKTHIKSIYQSSIESIKN